MDGRTNIFAVASTALYNSVEWS